MSEYFSTSSSYAPVTTKFINILASKLFLLHDCKICAAVKNLIYDFDTFSFAWFVFFNASFFLWDKGIHCILNTDVMLSVLALAVLRMYEIGHLIEQLGSFNSTINNLLRFVA